jgi:hypothetical protein
MLPKTSAPTLEQIQQWLSYAERKIAPRRFAMRTLVYSDSSIKKAVYFSLRQYDVALYPIEQTAANIFGDKHKFMPAYTCELISKGEVGPGHIGSLYAALDCIMPLMGFDYELPVEFEMWQDYDGEWLPVQASGGACKFQDRHGDVPNSRIYELVAAYETLSTRSDKRSKKFATLPQRLKEAASQANVATKYGLLAYYNVIEIIADDLLGSAEDGKPYPQKVKMEKLLSLFPHRFNVQACIKVSNARNKLAHSDGKSFHEEARLCREIALWAAEHIALELLKIPENGGLEVEA